MTLEEIKEIAINHPDQLEIKKVLVQTKFQQPKTNELLSLQSVQKFLL